MPRARKETPDAKILELAGKGMGEDAISRELAKAGTTIPPRTVGRRLAELRANGGRAAATTTKPHKAATKPSKPAPPPAPSSPAAPSSADVAEGVDLEHLPAELLTLAARDAFAAVRRELGPGGSVVAADRLAAVLERFARRLVEVRPPEKVDPVKDPTNVEARREILARWELLREPFEVSAPVVEQLQAHVDALRARALLDAPA